MTSLSAASNPIPSWEMSLTITASSPLRLSLSAPSATAPSPCSAAKPTITWPARRRAESVLRMSCVRSSSIVGTPRSFLSLVRAISRGRKSATAAAISGTSQDSNSRSQAAASSAAVATESSRVAGGAGSDAFAATSVTWAPRRAACRASAKPILPDERLPMKRTLSIGSRVPPAVTSTRTPSSRPSPGARSCVASAASQAAKSSAGSGSRPTPCSPWEASSPSPGARYGHAARGSAAPGWPAWPGADTSGRSSRARRRPAARGERRRGQQVVCLAVGQLGDRIGAGRRDQIGIGPLDQRQVRDRRARRRLLSPG